MMDMEQVKDIAFWASEWLTLSDPPVVGAQRAWDTMSELCAGVKSSEVRGRDAVSSFARYWLKYLEAEDATGCTMSAGDEFDAAVEKWDKYLAVKNG